MTTWEYRVETVHVEGATQLKKMTPEWLNSLGSDGWELVGLNTLSGMYGRTAPDAYLVFKRPLESAQQGA